MSNEVTRARNHLASLFTYGRKPDPEAEADARRSLATARIDREIRNAESDAGALDPVDTAHLVGLLFMRGNAAGDDQATERVARAIREIIYVVPLSAEARVGIAAEVVAGVQR